MYENMFKSLEQISEQNLLGIEEAKNRGRKVIGFYCLYSPIELAVAAEAIPLGLCGTSNHPIAAAEETLPRNLCPLIKSSYGFAATDTCPYFAFSDIIIADTTCDGKKKMFELLDQYRPVHVLQLPQSQDSESALNSWIYEMKRTKEIIENLTGSKITNTKINNAIRLMNKVRQIKKEFMDIAMLTPSPISGMDLLTVLFRSGFFMDMEQGIDIINRLTDAARLKQSPYRENTPRILLTGVPIGLGSDKVVRIIEESGGNVVCFENCGGYKQIFTVQESDDPIAALAKQYLSIPCSVMSPNPGRLDLLKELIERFSVNGVIDLTWQACHTYNVESYSIERYLTEETNLPMLHLETDYSDSDTEQLRVRVEAFLEMLK